MIQREASKERKEKEGIWFFSVSQKHGHVMSRPIYPSEQALIGDLIHSIEVASPQMAWVQMLFRTTDLSRDLILLKNGIIAAKKHIETPKIDLFSGNEKERSELYRDWYSKANARIKKIDDLAAGPAILMAIQGMWVGSKSGLMELPFTHCTDEEDSLAVFSYRDPRMLIELVERHMVEDISEYLLRYTGSRLEPPSFLITAEELPYFIHLPAGKVIASIRSISDEEWGTYSPTHKMGGVQGEETHQHASSRVMKISRPPKIEKVLPEVESAGLGLLASSSVRGLELLFESGKTGILISSENAEETERYREQLESVYGEMAMEPADGKPAVLRVLPRMVGLVA